MKSNFKFYGFQCRKNLEGHFDNFPMHSIIVESSLSLNELKDLFPFTHDEVKCVENVPFSNIQLNKPLQLTFGDPHLTPKNIIVTGVVHRKDKHGNICPFLRAKISDFIYLYFYILDYNPETRSGHVFARLTVPEDLKK